MTVTFPSEQAMHDMLNIALQDVEWVKEDPSRVARIAGIATKRFAGKTCTSLQAAKRVDRWIGDIPRRFQKIQDPLDQTTLNTITQVIKRLFMPTSIPTKEAKPQLDRKVVSSAVRDVFSEVEWFREQEHHKLLTDLVVKWGGRQNAAYHIANMFALKLASESKASEADESSKLIGGMQAAISLVIEQCFPSQEDVGGSASSTDS